MLSGGIHHHCISIVTLHLADTKTPAYCSCAINLLCGAAGLKALDPASYSFKQQLHQIVSDTLDAIPGNLIDLELGMPESQVKAGDPSQSPQHPQQAEQAQQPMETDQGQQAKQDNWDFAEEEAGSLRLPLFTGKVMAFVQYLLQYKVRRFVNDALHTFFVAS